MGGPLESVPRKTDPFERAFREVDGGTRYFGAPRGERRHPGMDLFVSKNTPVQPPADRAVLIGVTRHRKSEAGKTMGNALVFFVPDAEQPYFLAFLHLSPRTFRVLRERDIGTEIHGETGGRVVAYTGDSATERAGAHLHVTAMTTFQFGGTVYTAREFMEKYREGTLADFLGRRNFTSITPPGALRSRRSLAGYVDPMELVRGGHLRISSLPVPRSPLISEERPRAGEKVVMR